MIRAAESRRARACALVAGGAIASLVACVPGRQPTDPGLLGRLASAKHVAFAFETTPTCALESATADPPPHDGAAWSKLRANELANAQVSVVDRSTHTDERGVVRLLRVRDAAGKERWLRNAPAPNRAEVDRRWSCVFDADLLAPRVKPVSATVVRLVPNAPSCTSLTPILGDAADVTFEPYTVLGRRLVVTPAGAAAVVTLASAEGEHVLTVSGADLDTCFAVTKRAPSPHEEREVVAAWLGDTSAPPPNAPLPIYLHTAGLEDGACLVEGSGPTRHDECRAAPFGVASGGPSALGLPTLRFFRERATSAVHAYGGKLAPAEELAGINVHVRQVRGAGDTAGAFSKLLLASMLDTSKQKARGGDGYRLVRATDISNGATANAVLDVDVTYTMPKLETTTQDRRQKKARGKASAPNPKFAAMARRTEAATAAAARAEGEVAAYGALYGAPLPRCEGALPLACDLAPTSAVGAVRVAKRRARVAALEAQANALPTTVEQDDVATVDYRAKVHRRHGEATLTVKLTPTEALPGIPPVQLVRKVPFEAAEVEVIADPSKGVEGKAARPPEQPQVDAAVAASVLGEIDSLLATWMRRATAAAPPSAFEPGSRAQLALLARWVASNRRVKLVSDLTEDRAELLASGQPIEYPIAIPEGAGRCWSFVAVPARGAGDVNLALRTQDARTLVARDARTATDAGFEVCAPPGRYLLQLSTPSGGASGPIALGMFESTPGVDADADLGPALPPPLRRQEPSAPVPAPARAPTPPATGARPTLR